MPTPARRKKVGAQKCVTQRVAKSAGHERLRSSGWKRTLVKLRGEGCGDDLGAVGDDDEGSISIHPPGEEQVSQAAIAFFGLGGRKHDAQHLLGQPWVVIDSDQDASRIARPARRQLFVPEAHVHPVNADLGRRERQRPECGQFEALDHARQGGG